LNFLKKISTSSLLSWVLTLSFSRQMPRLPGSEPFTEQRAFRAVTVILLVNETLIRETSHANGFGGAFLACFKTPTIAHESLYRFKLFSCHVFAGCPTCLSSPILGGIASCSCWCCWFLSGERGFVVGD